MSEIILRGITVEEFLEKIKKLIEVNQNKNLISKESNQNKLLSRVEVSKLLKVSLPTLYNWSKLGLLSPKKIGRRVLYKLEDIEALIAQKYPLQ